MPGYTGYEFRSEDMERLKAIAKDMVYKCPKGAVKGFEWRDGTGQYNKEAMKHNIDLKYGHSKVADEYNTKYSKDGKHPMNNSSEVLKEMVAVGGDVSKEDDFSPLSLLGVSHISDVLIESEAARGNKMGEEMYGYKKLDSVQEQDIAKEVDAHDAKKIGGSDLGYYAQYQGRYQGGHQRFDWLEGAQRRVSEYDEEGNVVENEHVQMEWLPQTKSYDPDLAYAGPQMRGVPRNI